MQSPSSCLLQQSEKAAGRSKKSYGTVSDVENNIMTGEEGGQSRTAEAANLAYSYLVLGPLVVLYWRGTFNYISASTFHDVSDIESRLVLAAGLFTFGLVAKICLDLSKHSVDTFVNADTNQFLAEIAKFIVIYLDSLCGVAMWVGGFNLLYSGPKLYWYSLTGILLGASCLLLLLRGFHCTGAGAPLSTASDTVDHVFNPQGYLSVSMEDGWSWILANTILSYSVLHSLMICCWWGLWELENNYIMEEMEITIKDIQAWDSVLISVVLGIAVLYSQRYMVAKDKLEERAASNLVAIMAFISVVNYWRGIWSLLDFYFLPDIPEKENLLVSHVAGFLFLFILGASSNLTMSSRRDDTAPLFIHNTHLRISCLKGPQAEEQERRTLLPEERVSSPLLANDTV